MRLPVERCVLKTHAQMGALTCVPVSLRPKSTRTIEQTLSGRPNVREKCTLSSKSAGITADWLAWQIPSKSSLLMWSYVEGPVARRSNSAGQMRHVQVHLGRRDWRPQASVKGQSLPSGCRGDRRTYSVVVMATTMLGFVCAAVKFIQQSKYFSLKEFLLGSVLLGKDVLCSRNSFKAVQVKLNSSSF